MSLVHISCQAQVLQKATPVREIVGSIESDKSRTKTNLRPFKSSGLFVSFRRFCRLTAAASTHRHY